MKCRRSLALLPLLPLLIGAALFSCAPPPPPIYSVSPSIAARIDKGAQAIRIKSRKAPRELYLSIRTILVERGFPFHFENESLLNLSTEYAPVPFSVSLQVTVAVDAEKDGTSTATLSGLWMCTADYAPEGQRVTAGARARWDPDWGGGNESTAFGALASIAEQTAGDSVVYIVPQAIVMPAKPAKEPPPSRSGWRLP